VSLHPLHKDNVTGKTYLEGSWCAFDFETTNVDFGSALEPANRVVCVSWKTKGEKVKSYYGNVLEAAEFWKALDAADFAIAQHAKFECHWLFRLNYDPTEKLWADPMLLEWVLLGNNPDSLSLSLDAMCRRYGLPAKERFIASLMSGGVCPSRMPKQYLIARCERDVETTAELFERQVDALSQSGGLAAAVTRCLFTPVLAAIERNGIVLDRDRVLETHSQYAALYAELKQRMRDVTGGIDNERSPLAMIPFVYGVFPRVKQGKNWREMTDEEKAAVKPLYFKELAYRDGKKKRGKPSKSWPEGRPLLNKKTLEILQDKATTEEQRAWVTLRKELGRVGAAISKNLDFFKGVVTERGGKFYAEIQQGVTATHRTNGRGKPIAFALFDGEVKSAQGQNTPREFKRLQKPRDADYLSGAVDAKQLEFRIAAALCEDAQALADVRNPDFDAHLQTLTVMLTGHFDRSVYLDLLQRYRRGDKKVKEQRADNVLCKSHTYKPLFGGERGTPLQESYYKWFREHYKGITDKCTSWLKEVEKSAAESSGLGQLQVVTGLVFRWRVSYRDYGNSRRAPLAVNAKNGKLLKPSVFNTPIQYFATGECVPIAVTHLYYRIKKDGIRAILTNTVHDNADAEVHKDDADKWREAAVNAFTRDVFRYLRVAYKFRLKVPLGVEISLGTHLGEGQQYSVDVENEAA
jgi:hypothetical protein